MVSFDQTGVFGVTEATMDLAQRLADELTGLRQKAGKTDTLNAFSTDYERLLHLLTATMRTMKSLAVAQGAWLQQQQAKTARMN